MAVSVRAVGSMAISTGVPTVVMPTHQAGDFLLLLAESANTTITIPSGWTPIKSTSGGTANAAGGLRLEAWYKMAASSSEPNVVLNDSGSYTAGLLISFQGVDPSTPVDVSSASFRAASTTLSLGGVTTTVPNCMILFILGLDRDLDITNQVTAWTSDQVTGLTEIFDQISSAGVGGGFAVATGLRASTAAMAGSTATQASSTVAGQITVALRPAPEPVASNSKFFLM